MGPIGVVIGATNSNIGHWREKLPKSIFLMPGIGAQGGEWGAIRAGLNEKSEGVWVPISRGITQVKKQMPNKSDYIDEVKRNINRHYEAMQKTLQLS
jgi:orotidine-5'-phosphate decarboxylase